MTKITAKDKVYYCKQYLEGNMSQDQIAKATHLTKSSIRKWIDNYESMGTDAFTRLGHKRYSKQLKIQAVEDFLAGQDSQYGICKKYGIKSTKKLVDADMTQSMSRVGKCIDNGPMEGFWGIIKRERYYGKRFINKESLIQMIENYIEYYNNKRLQRNLGVLTPIEKYQSYMSAA